MENEKLILINNIELNKASIVNGITQIGLSIFWTWHYANLFYLYHFTDVQFVFMFPNWILILFILMGILGMLIGVSVLLGKRQIRRGYFQLLGLLILGVIINLLIVA